MRLGIMQPYFFPYIGYFQLIAGSDQFVIYDNAQFIKGGWINRNRILAAGRDRYITLPVRSDNHKKRICERVFAEDFRKNKQRMFRQIGDAYRRAPHFAEVCELVERCLACDDPRISVFVPNALRQCCAYLGITTPLVAASTLNIDLSRRGQDRVLAIARALGASHYINPIGGRALYHQEVFQKHGLKLSFLKPRDISYRQFANPHIPFLSILDVMMFNDRAAIRTYLSEYELLS